LDDPLVHVVGSKERDTKPTLTRAVVKSISRLLRSPPILLLLLFFPIQDEAFPKNIFYKTTLAAVGTKLGFLERQYNNIEWKQAKYLL